MLAERLDRGGPAQKVVLAARDRLHRDDLGPALGQRAGLVDDQRVDGLEALQRLGVPDEHAEAGGAADADHDRHRRRQAERARAGDDQHSDRRDQPEGESRLRPERRPDDEGDDGDGDHQRNEPSRDAIGEPLDRRAAALRLRHHLHDLRQHGVAADLLRAHRERAGLVERAADDLVADALRRRHGFAGDQELVERAAPVDDLAVDRDFFARPHAQQVADAHRVERHVLVAAVGAQAPRGLRREVEQGADRAAGLRARAQLQHLAEQGQRGDDRRRLEIDRDRAVRVAEGCGEQGGGERRDDAVGIGDADAHRDEREHVEVARSAATPGRGRKTARRPTARPGVARTNCNQVASGPPPMRCPPIAMRNSGAVSASATQNRRVMSMSSTFGPASAAATSGSNAMPQIGQAPGPACRISGCIGQV